LTGINLHGLAVDPEERLAALTSVSGSDTICIPHLVNFTVVGVFDHGGISKPNDIRLPGRIPRVRHHAGTFPSGRHVASAG
jgi:hypothetical protein